MSNPTDNPYGAPTTAPLADGFSIGRSHALKLKRIDPVSCGKLLGVLYVFLGLLMSVFLVLATLVGIATGGNDFAAGIVGSLVMAIFFPIFYGIAGFIGGIIMAFIYNLIAAFIGGIEMQFEE